MTNKFRTLDDVDVKGKRVLLRVDLNVPMETAASATRPGSSASRRPSREISDKGGKVDPARAFRPAEGHAMPRSR